VDGEKFNLGEIGSAWDHRPGVPQPAENLSPLSRRFAASEASQFIDTVWRSLDCQWIPAHKAVVLRAQHKASQLQLAQSLGFEIPPTLITNSPAEFREFYRRQGGRIISKVFHRNVLLREDDPAEPAAFQCMTHIVSNREVGYGSSIRYSPVIFQGYVPKRLELRVTVVGRRVLAAAIHSQDTNRTRHDWRHADLQHTRYEPYTLPADVEARCLCLLDRMGLCFGAIDLVLTPDGRYVFLEINPSGQWRWVETMTGLPIADAMAELLIEYDRLPRQSCLRGETRRQLCINAEAPRRREAKVKT
jgi:glutathione synthase/RimK-type ligase-like ATP-grasp enzyme